MLRICCEAALLLPLNEGRPAESTGAAHQEARRSLHQLTQEAHCLPVSGQNGQDEGAEDGAHGPFETRPELWQGRNYGGVRWVAVFNCSSNIAEVHGSTGSSNREGSLFYVQHARKRP